MHKVLSVRSYFGIVAFFLLATLFLSASSKAADYVSVSATGADRSVARHMSSYLRLTPSEGHGLAETGPTARPQSKRAAAAPPAATFGYTPSGLTSEGGASVVTARIHPVIVNCANGQCWGTVGTAITPDQFVTDYGASPYSHVVDQYVGSTANGRYTLGTGVHINNFSYSAANQASNSDVLNALAIAVNTLGTQFTGYHDIYLVFFPVGVDVCTTTACVSGGTFCATHGFADGPVTSGGKSVHILYSAQPYQDIPGCKVITGPDEVTDSTATAIAQEISQIITDPDLDAWQNTTSLTFAAVGAEIASECSMVKPIHYPTLTLNTHQYKIPLLYSNAVRECVDQP